MATSGEIRNQIDRIWDAFWSGGISNSLEVIEQITHLLFLRRLDDLQALEEDKATRFGKPIERRIFPKGKDPNPRGPEGVFTEPQVDELVSVLKEIRQTAAA